MSCEAAVIVDAPLCGEWLALHTPAERVPSHGTDYLGQRYAYDFIQSDARSNLPYVRGFWRHLLAAQPAESFLCWDQPVYSIFDGVVTSVGVGWPDRRWVNLIAALFKTTFVSPRVDGDDIRPLAGNYIIVQGHSAVAFYAHLREGSVTAVPGQQLRTRDVIGRVGNSGNSTMPHLHFHLMGGPDILNQSGVPCRFRSFERLDGEKWVQTTDGVPDRLQRIRWAPVIGGL